MDYDSLNSMILKIYIFLVESGALFEKTTSVPPDNR
jgi:hypothetical protein